MRFFNARRLGLLLVLKSEGFVDDGAVSAMRAHPHLARLLGDRSRGWKPRALLWDWEGVTALSEEGRAFLGEVRATCIRMGLRLLLVHVAGPLRRELRLAVDEGLEFFDERRCALRAVGLDGPRPLGRILIEMGKIGRRGLELALARQQAEEGRKRLGELLVESGLVGSADVHAALRLQRLARCLLA